MSLSENELDHVESRRGPHRPSNDRLGRWLRRLSPGDALAILALLGMLLMVLGYRRFDPEPAVLKEAEIRRTNDSLLTKRVDSLSNQLWFTNFLGCTQLAEPKRPDRCRDILIRGPNP